MKKNLWKYIFTANPFTNFSVAATIFSWFFPNLTIKEKFLITLFGLLFIIGYALFCYIKDLLHQIELLKIQNEKLTQVLETSQSTLNDVMQNRDYLIQLLKKRDNAIAIYEKLLQEIDLFHLYFLATPSDCERKHISQLKNYLTEQIQLLKEHDSND